MRMVVENMIAKGKKVDAAFIDLEKAFDRIDWEAVWDNAEGVWSGWKFTDCVKLFYKDANTCVKVNRKVGESFKIKGGVRHRDV